MHPIRVLPTRAKQSACVRWRSGPHAASHPHPLPFDMPGESAAQAQDQPYATSVTKVTDNGTDNGTDDDRHGAASVAYLRAHSLRLWCFVPRVHATARLEHA